MKHQIEWSLKHLKTGNFLYRSNHRLRKDTIADAVTRSGLAWVGIKKAGWNVVKTAQVEVR